MLSGPAEVAVIGLAFMLVAVAQLVVMGKILDGPERGAAEIVGLTSMISFIFGEMLGIALVLMGLWGMWS